MPINAKDVALALFGGSVSLAGLLLVFAGLLFAQAAAFPPDTTDDSQINKFKDGGRRVVPPFVLSLFTAGSCLFWLTCGGSAFFWLSWWAFIALLVVTAGYGIWVTHRLL